MKFFTVPCYPPQNLVPEVRSKMLSANQIATFFDKQNLKIEMIDLFGFKLVEKNLMKKKKNEIRFWAGHAQASRSISEMVLTFQH